MHIFGALQGANDDQDRIGDRASLDGGCQHPLRHEQPVELTRASKSAPNSGSADTAGPASDLTFLIASRRMAGRSVITQSLIFLIDVSGQISRARRPCAARTRFVRAAPAAPLHPAGARVRAGNCERCAAYSANSRPVLMCPAPCPASPGSAPPFSGVSLEPRRGAASRSMPRSNG
jgi:hypothetical protein